MKLTHIATFSAFCLVVMLIASIQFNAKSPEDKTLRFTLDRTSGNADIYKAKFFMKSTKTAHGFRRLEGQEIGLDRGYKYDIRDYTDPFWFGRGTASGDYDKDGWPDIVFGSNSGFFLYRNIGGSFERQALSLGSLEQELVYAVAMVDLNNDGWLDIFLTTFNSGNFLILNEKGRFDTSRIIPVPNRDGVITLSPAFSDLNHDGYLDIVNGNIALGVVTGFYIVDSRRQNSIVFNRNLQFKEVPIESDSGETMATLASDINNDGITDIYFGNDFMSPDKILIGNGDGYNEVKGNEFIPFTPFFSMGADTGDINNDLNLDFLVTGTMYVAPYVGYQEIDGKTIEEYSQFKGDLATCNGIEDLDFRNHCRRIRGTNYIRGLDRTQVMTQKNKNTVPETCDTAKDQTDKDICLTKLMWALITSEDPEQDCDQDYAQDDRLRSICEILKIRQRKFERRDLYGGIPQDDRNMLYRFDPDSKTLKTVEGFQHPGGWTWNSKIVDLDNDGWQDIVTSDGTVRTDDYGWNVLMKNINGERFEQRQFTEGIVSDFGLYSFVTIDMDQDGDLDLIGNSAEGPVQVYENNSSGSHHSIAISVEDPSGNHFGIGAKILVHAAKGEFSQIREMKASGGYMSFEPAVAYFGLGDRQSVESIEVEWPDKTRNTYPGPFASDHHYRIVRNKK